jgi:hypothetical protein
MFYDIVDAVILFSFPYFFKLHRVAPLLQTCSTYEVVLDHAWICEYICLLAVFCPHMREHMRPLCFWAWLTSLNKMSSNFIHLPSSYMSLFLIV